MHDWYCCDMYCLGGIEEVGAWSGTVVVVFGSIAHSVPARAVMSQMKINESGLNISAYKKGVLFHANKKSSS